MCCIACLLLNAVQDLHGGSLENILHVELASALALDGCLWNGKYLHLWYLQILWQLWLSRYELQVAMNICRCYIAFAYTRVVALQ